MAQDSKTNASNGAQGANGTHNNGGRHQGSTATLLGMQQNHDAQSYRNLEEYTASLAMLEEQDRQRRYLAREDRQRQPQTPSSNTSPISPASASSNGYQQWMTTGREQSQDAIQQYQRMLLDEQRRRNQELGRNS
ncbi:hypothetical protein M409DRAFT_56277 [Zasmidium cellare ATCC 36951]|uniref:Uncharacterized protein n=1 Tax=Zasmidium cellare ATCC 36951 TaxID=1080233 RepID=A0A6A6CCL2_ZASCE|nr:uncharacterized protein M409DRAFT_56277 [Zasmidium cellare ATCC 36951]KAF2164924.1 hypothetical protein M409DRAFT_56277 [Zasmidium cellare ATCC 36951]